MRHGQTLFNKRHLIQGWCDSPLTDFGIYQAQIKNMELSLTVLLVQHLSARATL